MPALYLAKVIGIYLIIGGFTTMMRRGYFIPIVGTFIEEKLTRFIWVSVQLIVGIFFVVGFQDWSTLSTSILTIFGWMLALEGLMYLIVPDAYLKQYIKMVNVRTFYVVGGVVSMIIGAYLAAVGFGWIVE